MAENPQHPQAHCTTNNNVQLENKRVLLIGAGGAARGVISPLLEASVAQLIITNRTLEKAQQIWAYTAPATDTDLKAYLHQFLPSHFVPAHIFSLPTLT